MELSNVRLQLRTDTLTNWESYNPVLKSGECAIAILSDGTRTLKIGDGTSTFKQLQLSSLDSELWNKVIHGKYSENFNKLNQLSIINISQEDFYRIVDTEQYLSDALYIIEPSFLDAFGQNIKNVAEPSVATDAATKYYVDSHLSSIELEDYYKKTETSSSTELNDKFSTCLTSHQSLTAYLTKSDATNTYETKSDLTSNYYTKSAANNTFQYKGNYLTAHQSLTAYLPKTDAANTYETKSDLTSNYYNKTTIDSKLTSLTSYLTKTEAANTYETIQNANNISVAFDGKIQILSNDLENKVLIGNYSDGTYMLSNRNLSAVNINAKDYYDLASVGALLSDVLYIISSDGPNAYGMKILNVAEPTLSNDAATKNYVDQNASKYIIRVWSKTED